MALELFHKDEYKNIIQEHLFNTIVFLMDNGMEFSIAAEVRHLRFDPPLPREISSSFDDVALFVVAGYTFESCQISEDDFSFEAGFGKDGVSADVSMPILSIKQIFADNYPIAINISEPKRKIAKIDTNKSMEALLRNPENSKFLKKQ